MRVWRHRIACALVVLGAAGCVEREDMPDGALPDGALPDGGLPDGAVLPPCPLLCGRVALPSPRVGATSFAPPGCDGAASFRLAWSYEVATAEGAAAIPVVAEVTGDGLPDLIVNARGLTGAFVLAGLEGGLFAQTPTYLPAGGVEHGGWGADVGDFDGDGLADVVAGDRAQGALSWRSSEAGAFTLVTSGLPAGVFAGAGLGDLNGDGFLDALFGAAAPREGLAVAFADGEGGWVVPGVAGLPVYDGGDGPTSAGYFAFTDLDLDEDLDVFAFGIEEGSALASVYRNQGDGTSFAPFGSFGRELGTAPPAVVQGLVGDLDCDGQTDLAVGGALFSGNGTSWAAVASVDDAIVSHLGDLDGDGDLDLVTHAADTGLGAYLNDGTGTGWTPVGPAYGLPDQTFLPPGLAAAGGGDVLAEAHGIDLADVDGDGRLDVVRSYRATAAGGDDRSYLELWLRD